MRKPIIAGNWKMNKTMTECIELLKEIKAKNLDQEVEAVVCVPFTNLSAAKEIIADTDIQLGAQNMYFEEKGAFTGEISPEMLEDLKVDYVILGHSERREIFKESDELINKKIHAALAHHIKPILCCGETLEEREAGKAKDKVKHQILEDLKAVSKENILKITIAYEPIWAIGTGKTASSEDADEMCEAIRQLIGEQYGEDIKEKIRIQYGGSVKPDNVKELMAKENIDGALVGGASLKADSFSALVNFKK